MCVCVSPLDTINIEQTMVNDAIMIWIDVYCG